MADRKIFSGGEFLITDATPEDVFTPEDFTDEHKMILETARGFVEKEIQPNLDRLDEKDHDLVLGLLAKAGDNSHEARQVRFTTSDEIRKNEDLIKAYIFEAIEIEKAGLTIDKSTRKDPEMPAELIAALTEMPTLKAAFEGLSPGRQRGYILHFAQPKQVKTREARIEKHIPNILSGKGLHD